MTTAETATPEIELIDLPDDEADASQPDIDQALIEEFAARQAAQPATRQVSLLDLYGQFVDVVCAGMGYRTNKLRSETHAVKILELTLFWALNNRNQPQGATPVFPSEVTEDETPTPVFEPDETVEAADDQSDEA